MIKVVLFDIGGVIIKIPENRYYKYLSEVGSDSSRIAECIINKNGPQLESGAMSINRFNNIMSKELGIPKNKVGWLAFFKRFGKLNNGITGVIKSLHKNYKIGFLSNVDKSRYTYALKHQMRPILYLFDYKFASFELGTVKPSHLIYIKVCRLINAKPSEVLFIDNNLDNVISAKEVGMESLHFTTIRKLKLDLKHLGIDI